MIKNNNDGFSMIESLVGASLLGVLVVFGLQVVKDRTDAVTSIRMRAYKAPVVKSTLDSLNCCATLTPYESALSSGGCGTLNDVEGGHGPQPRAFGGGPLAVTKTNHVDDKTSSTERGWGMGHFNMRLKCEESSGLAYLKLEIAGDYDDAVNKKSQRQWVDPTLGSGKLCVGTLENMSARCVTNMGFRFEDLNIGADGIGGAFAPDYDYNDVEICLKGSFSSINRSAVSLKDQTVKIDLRTDTLCSHEVTLTVTRNGTIAQTRTTQNFTTGPIWTPDLNVNKDDIIDVTIKPITTFTDPFPPYDTYEVGSFCHARTFGRNEPNDMKVEPCP